MVRKLKRGTFYLLVSDSGLYKFGATISSVQRRLTSAQRHTGESFRILIEVSSNIVFKTENNFRWAIVNGVEAESGCAEFFRLKSNGLTEKDLLEIARSVK